MLVRCLYASRPAAPLAADVLDSILAQSQKNNPRRGITGMLCFTHEIFIQVIEGGRDEVCKLFNAIVRDERNVDVRILVYEEITERKFGNWTMGQVNVEQINPAMLLKYSEKSELNPFACSGTATMALLDEFVATASIMGRGH